MLTDIELDDWYWASFCLAPFVSLAVGFIVFQLTRRRRGEFKSSILALIAFLITGALMIFSVRILMLFLVRTDQASAGAYGTLDNLPYVDGIELAAVQDTSFYSDIGGCCCSYGRLWLLYGTSLPPQEALGLFARQLSASGWIAEGKQYETDRSFVRGAYEFIDLGYGGTGGNVWEWGKHPDYLAAENNYPHLIDAQIDYILPNRNVCWGQ